VTNTESKILTYEQAVDLACVLRSGCFRLVITNGCFDLLHVGHIRYLEAASLLGDQLMVGVNADWAVAALKGPGRPVNTTVDRLYALAALSCVKYVVAVDSVRVDEFIGDMRAAVWAKGGDYALDTLDNGEVKSAALAGTRIEIIPITEGFSTTTTIKNMGSPYLMSAKCQAQAAQEVRPEPSLRPEPSIVHQQLSNIDPQPCGPIASEWGDLVAHIDQFDRITELLVFRFSAVCRPEDSDGCKPKEEKEPRRQSDMADGLAFQSKRILEITAKLASMLDRCQL